MNVLTGAGARARAGRCGCMGNGGGDARPATLSGKKRFGDRFWNQKSSHFSEGVFGRFSKLSKKVS